MFILNILQSKKKVETSSEEESSASEEEEEEENKENVEVRTVFYLYFFMCYWKVETTSVHVADSRQMKIDPRLIL